MKYYVYSVVGTENNGYDTTTSNSYGVVRANNIQETKGLAVEHFKEKHPKSNIMMFDVLEFEIDNNGNIVTSVV